MIPLLPAATLAIAMLATAPAAPPSASLQPIAGGPVIPGVCVLSPEAVLAGSKVGEAASARLQQLTADAERPLQAERTALETEAKAAQTEQKRQALAGRVQALQTIAAQRSRQLEATREHVIQRISQQAQPLIATAYAAHGCGLLFRRTDLLGGNPANDLTPEVVRALDAKLTTLSFELESPTAAPAGQTGR